MPGEMGLSLTDERRFERLPEQIRRWQRFGGMEAAALAEAMALRREIDALAARYSRWQAARRAAVDHLDEGEPTLATWLHLRRAGLALVAEIERQRSIGCGRPVSAAVTAPVTASMAAPAAASATAMGPDTGQMQASIPEDGAADCTTLLPARRHA